MERWLVWGALAATVAAFALSAQLAIRIESHPEGAVLGLDAVYREHLGGTRMILGAILVLAWPALLHLGARLLRLQFRRPGAFLTFLGILLGAFAYCLSFLPWPALAGALVLPPIVALALYMFVLRLTVRQACMLWLLQGTLTLAISAGAIWGLESAATGTALNPVRELPAIYEAARQAPGERTTVHLNRDTQRYVLVWASSGSKWMDERANRVQAYVNIPAQAGAWYATVETGGETVAESSGQGTPASTPVFVPRPDTGYRVRIQPTPERGTGAQVVSLLRLKGTGGAVNDNDATDPGDGDG